MTKACRYLVLEFLACKSDIKKLCKIDGNQKKSKQEIIQCLSEEKRNSILSERNTQMSSECQDQVSFELLGEFEDLRLNPNLEKNCLDDVKKYCNNIKRLIFLLKMVKMTTVMIITTTITTASGWEEENISIVMHMF